MKQLFAELGDCWESFSITPDEVIESGETVVVLSHSESKGKETGKEVKLPWICASEKRRGCEDHRAH
jgi:hypothetical protein